MKNRFIVVLTTTNSIQSAEKIAQILVKEKLAACVNILSKIQSIYCWKEKICNEEEFLMFIKTQKKNYPRLEKRILKLHPYEVPELISIPIEQGNKNYLKWMIHETGLKKNIKRKTKS